MALGDPYLTLPEFKSYIRLDNELPPDDELNDVLDTASRDVENYCKRQFHDAGTPTARLYRRAWGSALVVDDFHTVAGLIVETDEDGDGTFETVWSAADFECHPLNGVVDGQPGWPFWTIHAVGDRGFPGGGGRANVRVTARWGWAAVPGPVKQAVKIVAAETFKLREAPFGTAGFGEFGVVRVRDNPMAKAKLDPYGRDIVAVG